MKKGLTFLEPIRTEKFSSVQVYDRSKNEILTKSSLSPINETFCESHVKNMRRCALLLSRKVSFIGKTLI